jgi:chaperonin cofactor prefoldin
MAKKKSNGVGDLEKELDDLEKRIIRYSRDVEKAFKHLQQIKPPQYPPRYGPQCRYRIKP